VESVSHKQCSRINLVKLVPPLFAISSTLKVELTHDREDPTDTSSKDKFNVYCGVENGSFRPGENGNDQLSSEG
jgi:hypothetical protein